MMSHCFVLCVFQSKYTEEDLSGKPFSLIKTSKSYKPGFQLPFLVFVSETFENEASLKFLLMICDAWNMCEALNPIFMVPAVFVESHNASIAISVSEVKWIATPFLFTHA